MSQSAGNVRSLLQLPGFYQLCELVLVGADTIKPKPCCQKRPPHVCWAPVLRLCDSFIRRRRLRAGC